MNRISAATGLIFAMAGLFVLTIAAPPASAAPKACDRACLEGMVGKYLEALAGHDPLKDPALKSARFVENEQPLKLGEGTWATISGLGTYRHIFSDPQGGAVAVITTIRENDVPAILDVRLRVVDRKVVEVESQIIRDAGGAGRYEKLAVPEPLWLQAVPVAERIPRDALAASVDKYFQGMQRNDPNGDYSFFDPDCNRLEHASQTTNLKTPEAYGHSTDTDFSSMGCEAQFKTGFLGFVTQIRNRRYVVVDEERQAVFAFADFDHNGTVRVLHMSTGKDFNVPAYFDVPRTLQVGEAFRMRRDKIHRIEMTLTELPYGMKPAFDVPPEPARPKEASAKPTCDRTCLGGVVDMVLQAIVDHRPGDAPLSPDVRYTENGQALKPGDGLWGTATAIAMQDDGLAQLGPSIAASKLYFADPATGQAGYFGAVNENGTPGMMLMRVRVVAGKVADIESVIVRQEGAGPRGGTMTLMRPLLLAEFTAKGFATPDPTFETALGPAERVSRSALANAVNRYLDGVEKSASAGVPLTADCRRRDNGDQTTGNSAAPPLDLGAAAFRPFALDCAAQLDSGLFRYLGKVRDRRMLMVDEERGLVLAVAMVDHPGAVRAIDTVDGRVTLPSNLLTPSTDMAAMLFKLTGGRITRIEALQRPVPYGMTSGWGN